MNRRLRFLFFTYALLLGSDAMPPKRKRSLTGIAASKSAAKLLSALQHPAPQVPVPVVTDDSAVIPELFSNLVHWNSVEGVHALQNPLANTTDYPAMLLLPSIPSIEHVAAPAPAPLCPPIVPTSQRKRQRSLRAAAALPSNDHRDDPAPPILATARKRQRSVHASDGSAAATSHLPALTTSIVSRLHQREVDAPMRKEKIKQQKRESRAKRRLEDTAARAAEAALQLYQLGIGEPGSNAAFAI